MRTSQISKLYLAKTKNLNHENIFFQPNHSRELKSGTAGGRNNSLKKTFLICTLPSGWPEQEQIKRDFFAGIQVLSFAKSWVGRNAQRNQGGAGEQVKGGGERLLVSTSILIGG